MNKVKTFKKLSNEEIFYDLGSGSGKVIFGAGLCYRFQQCNYSYNWQAKAFSI